MPPKGRKAAILWVASGCVDRPPQISWNVPPFFVGVARFA